MSARIFLSILACGALVFSISGCNDSNPSPSTVTLGGSVSGLSAA